MTDPTSEPDRGATIPERFDRIVAEHPWRPAILWPGGERSYAALGSRVDAVSSGLAARGVGRGHRVGLLCPNTELFPTAYLGILRAGATVVPVNLLFHPREMIHVLNDAGVTAFLYHREFASSATQIRDGVASLITDCVLEEGCEDAGFIKWRDAATAGGSGRGDSKAVETDTAVILYTSGTTGFPKGAMLTHRNLVANAWSVKQALRLTPGQDILVVVLPMFHAFAATVGMLTPLLHGMALAPLARFDPMKLGLTIAAVKATVFLGVPSMYALLLRVGDGEVRNWRSIRYGISGGAALPPSVMDEFERRFGFPLYEGDGPTECSPVTCVNPVGGRRKPSSVGLAVPGVTIRVLDDRGDELPKGTVGELCVRGANVMKGYWGHPEATAESFFGEWFRTGDLGYQDEDGYLFIIDRKKDLVIVNGMNVYPRIVEEALYRHPNVAEAAVVGEPSELHGEVPVAYVALKAPGETSEKELRMFCRSCLGRHEIPRRILFLSALPRTSTGKVLKRELSRHGEYERGVDPRG